MNTAVQALLDAQPSALPAGKHGRYRTWCACCAPQPEGHEGKPQRRSGKRPVLAWRTRLAAQSTLAGNAVESTY
jgi:hypothetical protein